MTLTNHLLSGSVIAKVAPLPIAIPLAFASHFVLDALPHFGYPNIEARIRHLRQFRIVVFIDSLVAIAISTWLISNGHSLWFAVGLIAYSPDLLWIYRFIVEERFGTVKPTKGNRFIQFHRNIQRYERPWGALVEIVFATVLLLAVRT